MIISTKRGTPAAELDKIIREFEAKGLSVTMIRGTDYNVFGLVGDTTVIDEKQVRANPYVENVQRVSEPYKKANRLFHEADSIIDVGGIKVGGSEKIAVMYAGKIVEYGTTDEIFYEPKHEYTKGLLRSIPRLDSRDHERLVPIEGTPVDMLNPPKGCPFAPRCGACMKVCLREMPPRTDFSDTHYTQCWLCQKAEFEAAQGGNVQ